jgi:hypothetical protein
VAAATTLHSPLVQAQQPPKAQTADDWKQKTGQTVTFKGSYGGPGTQSRALIAGLDADVVTLALSADVLKPAVLAIVLVAAWRVGCRALAVLRLPLLAWGLGVLLPLALMARFFSRVALLCFGRAYAVLALGETPPGPCNGRQ